MISAVQPGSTTVVALASRISAGPAMRSPASSSVRSNTGAVVRRAAGEDLRSWSIGAARRRCARGSVGLLHRVAGRDRLDRDRLDDQRPLRSREAEARAMRRGEVGDDLLRRSRSGTISAASVPA